MDGTIRGMTEDEHLAKIIFYFADWSYNPKKEDLRDRALMPRKGSCKFSVIRPTFLTINYTKKHIVENMIEGKDFIGFAILPYKDVCRINNVRCEPEPEDLTEHANIYYLSNGEYYYLESEKSSQLPFDIKVAWEKMINIARENIYEEKEDKREDPVWYGQNIPAFKGESIYINPQEGEGSISA